jgi:phage shock protein A
VPEQALTSRDEAPRAGPSVSEAGPLPNFPRATNPKTSMANYNAAKHTIEHPDGRTLAQLTDEVSGTEAFEIADSWAGGAALAEELREELSIAEERRREAESVADGAETKIEALKDEVERLRDRIAELEQEGAPAA